MSVNVPVSVWRRTSGNGELATTDESIETLSGLQITTLSGLDLIALSGSYTPVPGTVWETVETTPASIWRTTTGNNDSEASGPFDIADPQSNLIVDTAGNQLIDTGIEMDIIPDTVWEQDDSL